MIRKVLLSTVAFVAVSGTAFAADLPSRRAPPVYIPPPIPIFSWTGFYIGGDLGAAFGRDRALVTSQTGAGAFGPFNVGEKTGIIGGGHIGYNLSTQSFPLLAGVGGAGGVIGVEADLTGSDYRGSFGASVNPSNPAIHDQSEVQGSVRGRLGIAADRALFFVTGGAAVAEFKNDYLLGATPLQSISHDRIGYTVGGGVEYALTTNWSLRGEYRYSDFGSYTDRLPITAVNVSHREIMQRATLGFSYKFDTPMAAPVVARY